MSTPYDLKRCFKCDIEKPKAMFYKHRETADGYLNKCKECTKKDASMHREKNIERIRRYDRERGSFRGKKYRKAHNSARNLKVKNECIFCSSKSNIEKHHPDYSRPSYVVPLCKRCHKTTHIISRLNRDELIAITEHTIRRQPWNTIT